MAELEVAKAAKKIYETSMSKEETLWEKTKHIAAEVIIIVFAVTVSIGFHTWSEHRHEQKEVQQFLQGLKADLTRDIEEMTHDMKAYKDQKRFFSYLAALPKNTIASKDSIEGFKDNLFNFTGFKGNAGRYEGFKSSGKIGFIEEERLQNAILDIYEEDIPLLVNSTDFFKSQKLKYTDYLFDNVVDYPKGNSLQVLSSEPIKNRSKVYLSGVDQIIYNYKNCISQMQKVSAMIDKKYKK